MLNLSGSGVFLPGLAAGLDTARRLFADLMIQDTPVPGARTGTYVAEEPADYSYLITAGLTVLLAVVISAVALVVIRKCNGGR